ncbi:MAG TPA: hypothetical protein VMY76_00565 [Gemmatimonadales bacterium]|nr:hypothetical protein [Gemmatimonadales bacterium]
MKPDDWTNAAEARVLWFAERGVPPDALEVRSAVLAKAAELLERSASERLGPTIGPIHGKVRETCRWIFGNFLSVTDWAGWVAEIEAAEELLNWEAAHPGQRYPIFLVDDVRWDNEILSGTANGQTYAQPCAKWVSEAKARERRAD